MNQIFLISGMVILVSTAFLIMNTQNTAIACVSSSTNQTNSSSGVNGVSGNLTKSAFTSSNDNSIVSVSFHSYFVNPAKGNPCINR